MQHVLEARKICPTIGDLCEIFSISLHARLQVRWSALQRWRSGPEQKVTVQNVSVSDGGQAIVGNVTQNTVDKDKAGVTKSPPLITDQSGTAMPIIEPDEQSATTVPRIEQNQQPAPAIRRRRRA